MRIAINGKIALCLPTRLLLSRAFRGKIAQYVPDQDQQLAVREILLYLCKNRKQYKGFVLIDVQSHNGQTVSVIL